jgi:hypothetical protein
MSDEVTMRLRHAAEVIDEIEKRRDEALRNAKAGLVHLINKGIEQHCALGDSQPLTLALPDRLVQTALAMLTEAGYVYLVVGPVLRHQLDEDEPMTNIRINLDRQEPT